MNQVISGEKGNANIIYILYLVAILIGLTAVVGVIMAYVARGSAPEWLATHYRFQIRTFWIGFLYSVVSVATMVIVIGYILLIVVLVWWIVRCVKGMQYLGRGEPVPQPATWLF